MVGVAVKKQLMNLEEPDLTDENLRPCEDHHYEDHIIGSGVPFSIFR